MALASAILGPQEAARADDLAHFVGGKVCAECHAAETARWQRSHHAEAMQPATPATVLGDFADAKFDHFGVGSTFSRAGNKFMVRTDGPNGALHDYEIAYTFGVNPLQQYLIAMPGGRLQALGIAWDNRPKDQGGQRWFHLYPDQYAASRRSPALDRTRPDLELPVRQLPLDRSVERITTSPTNTYATTWSDVDVSCEACHGPGSRHVAWAKAYASPGSAPAGADAAMGLVAVAEGDRQRALGDEPGDRYCAADAAARLRGTRCLRRLPLPAQGDRQTIRRRAGRFLDAYLPALLEPGLYHADGQIDGEVYEYGSFLQSRMHRAGVTCSNCHDPHSATLRAEGNTLCAQCHMPARFDVAGASASPAGQCRRAMRQLPHADKDLYGRRCTPRSQHSRAASGPVRLNRHAERLQ